MNGLAYLWSRHWVRTLLVMAPLAYGMVRARHGLLTGPDYTVGAVLFVTILVALGFSQWQQEWSQAQYAETQDEETES